MPRVSSPAAAIIGATIRSARAVRGLTQDELAVATSIDSSNIRAYEGGRSLPNVRSLVRIAEALNVEVGALLAGVESEHFQTPVDDGRRRRAV